MNSVNVLLGEHIVMKFVSKLAVGAAAAAIVAGFGGAAFAQETTASIRGVVVGPDGAPLSGRAVTVVDSRTGTTRVFQTNDSGSFFARGLAVGGPYNVSVEGGQFGDETISELFLNLGENDGPDL